MGGKGEKKKAPTVAEIREPTARVRMCRTCYRLVMVVVVVVVVVVVLLKVGYEVI
jgi:t-SNARE complex subunit (syntaxin)